MSHAERREFVHAHRMCVFGYNRQNHGPSMSIVYYIHLPPVGLHRVTRSRHCERK